MNSSYPVPPFAAQASHPLASRAPVDRRSVDSVRSARGEDILAAQLTRKNGSILHPSTFIPISLGEAFESSLKLSSSSPVENVSLALEIQTTTGKIQLGRHDWSILAASEAHEIAVTWEMKEMGMTVLTVLATFESQGVAKEFVRYFKFNVAAPFAIKTKTHLPTSPNVQLTAFERERVYLEVHVQNVTNEPIRFDSIALVPVPQVAVVDAQAESTELLPGNIRQHLFVLEPPSSRDPFFPPRLPAGQLIPLGRLDLKWTSHLGEHGQLVTAALTRRVPPEQASTSASGRPEVDVIVRERQRAQLFREFRLPFRLALRQESPGTVQLAVQYATRRYSDAPHPSPMPNHLSPRPSISTPVTLSRQSSMKSSKTDRFPPKPVLNIFGPEPSRAIERGEISLSGVTLVKLPALDLQTPLETADTQVYRGELDFELSLMPTRRGRADLEGLRVIQLNDPNDWRAGGRVLREWTSLGDVVVEGDAPSAFDEHVTE